MFLLLFSVVTATEHLESPIIITSTNPQVTQEIFSNIRQTRDEENTPLEPQFLKMEQWWELYMDNKNFVSLYDSRSARLISEATYFIVILGFEEIFKKLSREEVRTFSPLELGLKKENELGKIINEVCKHLKAPSISLEASYALKQAAWSIFAKHNPFT